MLHLVSYLQLLLPPQVDVTVGGQAQLGGQPIKWPGFFLLPILHLTKALAGHAASSLSEACATSREAEELNFMRLRPVSCSLKIKATPGSKDT